ncbi:MAG: hypothetical protein ACE5HB_02160 [Terriglobia bacterium]
MKRSRHLEAAWARIRTSVEGFPLPASLEKATRWVERHPRTVISGALVVALALLLAQSPAEPVEHDAYNGETPLFV